MKIIYNVSILLFTMILSGCITKDYDPGNTFRIEKNRLVISSILNPIEPIEVLFYATSKTDSGYIVVPVYNSYVILKENQDVLFEGVCQDTMLRINKHPRPGAQYSIQVKSEGLETISAFTQIPDSITCTATIYLLEQSRGETLLSLKDFKYPQDESSLWITSYVYYKTNDKIQNNNIYSYNILIDDINRSDGNEMMNEFVGSSCYEAFLRIKNKNLLLVDSILFTPSKTFALNEIYLDYKLKEFEVVKLITASKEYDQYNRSYYQQKSMIIEDEDGSGIFYQPIRVYSNITNGLGIFAGMSEATYCFPINSDPHSD